MEQGALLAGPVSGMWGGLLALLAAAQSSEPTINENTVPPLRTIYDCTSSTSSGDDCGPAIRNRTTFQDWCALSSALQSASATGGADLISSLAGLTIDIIMVPDEDETLFLKDSAGRTYIGGLVGEVITELATLGGFEFNAIITIPPTDYHASSR